MGRGPTQHSMKEIVKNYRSPHPDAHKPTVHSSDTKPGYSPTEAPVETGYTLGSDPRFMEVLEAASKTSVDSLDNAGHFGSPYEQEWFKDLETYLEGRGLSPELTPLHLGSVTNYPDQSFDIIGRFFDERPGKKRDILLSVRPSHKGTYRGHFDIAAKERELIGKYPENTELHEAIGTHKNILLEVKHQARRIDKDTYDGLLGLFRSNNIPFTAFLLYQDPPK